MVIGQNYPSMVKCPDCRCSLLGQKQQSALVSLQYAVFAVGGKDWGEI